MPQAGLGAEATSTPQVLEKCWSTASRIPCQQPCAAGLSAAPLGLGRVTQHPHRATRVQEAKGKALESSPVECAEAEIPVGQSSAWEGRLRSCE